MDAVIVSDPGVFKVVKETIPNMEVHISTQASTTNYNAANFWYNKGAQRIVTARELSLEETKEIREHIPEDMDIEAFVHGAMCMSYSGKCTISNYTTGRDANKGSCAQSCRWKYTLMEENSGEYTQVVDNIDPDFFFNTKDLCMIEYIPQIFDAGITSLKIEGRMKTAYYVATTVRAYRMALDSLTTEYPLAFACCSIVYPTLPSLVHGLTASIPFIIHSLVTSTNFLALSGISPIMYILDASE